MKEYHKIQTVFHRDPDNNYKTLLLGVWSEPEFDLLQDIEWVWTEKIDGTNIRVMWDGLDVTFGGKTDKAEIPAHLLVALKSTFTPEKMDEQFAETSACLYGEGYGVKIQKGGNYIHDGVDFILFDCKIGPWWIRRTDLEGMAELLGINIVPIVNTGTLHAAVDFCKKGYKSTIACNPNYNAEGLVMKPREELINRAGRRIITKIKFKDF